MVGLSREIIVGEEQEQSIAIPASGNAPLFHHSLLCQLGLPRRRMDERIFERRSGAASLLMTAGHWYTGQGWEPQPLPYGTRPRLVFVNVITEAVRTRSRTVHVESSVRGFLRRLGIDCGGNSMKGFKKQMIALASCQMQLGFRTELGVGQIDAKPISRFEAWIVDEDRQRGMWPGELDLSSDFFESMLEHAVPLDPQALAGLQNSAMALDIYCWLAHRLCRVSLATGTVVSWLALKEQFGQEYASPDEFRRSFIEAMDKARQVYPDARIDIVRGGLRLLPSAPPVRKSMILTPRIEKPATSSKTQIKIADALEAAAEKTPATPTAPTTPMPSLRMDTVIILKRLCAGWTTEELWQRSPFKGLARMPVDFDERFKNWAKEFVKCTPSAQNPALPAATSSQLKPATREKVQEMAPGYSADWLEEKFFEWNRSKGTTLRDADQAFLAWAESFTKGKRP